VSGTADPQDRPEGDSQIEDRTYANLPGREDPAPGEGTARVEGHLSSHPTPGTEEDGAGESVGARAKREARRAADQVQEQAEEWGEDAGEQLRNWQRKAGRSIGRLSERAKQWSSRARAGEQLGADRQGAVAGQGNDVLELVRQHPLIAAGLAFGVGYLLAGKSGREPSGVVGRATGSLRTAIVGGISTMIMQEMQELLDEHGGPIGLLHAVTGRDSDG
jgi:ElaB/YqjD/DUF883 family membrane-anchored ribosome-binding protein